MSNDKNNKNQPQPAKPAESGTGEVVAMKVADLEALIATRAQAAVQAALAAQKATPASSSVDAEAIARAVAQVLVANQNVQANSDHAQRMAAARARDAKLEKCLTCGQVIAACGGPWLRASQADSEHAKKLLEDRNIASFRLADGSLRVDAAGYVCEANGRRLVLEELNHKLMCVFPKSEENTEWFIGLRINGKSYLSNGPGHELWVPAVNDFASIIGNFENGERRSRQQLKHIRQSGSVSASGQTNVARPVFTH